MIVDFSFKNYKSFKELQRFSMRRDTGIAQEKSSILAPNAFLDEGLNRVGAVYGANASGKSNFLDAIFTLTTFVTEGKNSNVGFIDSDEPSVFRMVFIYNGIRYDYALSVAKSRLEYEKLSIYYSNQPTLVFEYFANPRNLNLGRLISSNEGTAVNYNSQKEIGKPILYFLKDSDNLDVKNAFDFFKNGIVAHATPRITSELAEARLKESIEEDAGLWDFYNAIIPAADLGIQSVKLVDVESDMNTEQLDLVAEFFIKLNEAGENNLSEADKAKIKKSIGEKVKRASFTHKIDNNLVNFDFQNESNGTIAASGVFLDLRDVLEHGGVYVVDEIDCSIHPTIIAQIIKIFNSEDTNPNGAQLIFSTHDISILDQSIYGENILDRDQIWFVEKSESGVSILYPLTQINGVRKDDNLYRKYISGRYGAVPKASLYYEMLKYWEDKKSV